MNAKEISDATLESVTPANDDLLLIYDTSEETTGKATIADIAPKVAENIGIATLPAVTPDDNDLMILYDVSEGTTGKAPIAKIANFITSLSVKKIVQSQTTETEVHFTDSYVVPESGGYIIALHITNVSAGVRKNSLWVNIENLNLMTISNTSSAGWANVYDNIYIPLKKGVTLNFIGDFETGGFRYSYSVKKTS